MSDADIDADNVVLNSIVFQQSTDFADVRITHTNCINSGKHHLTASTAVIQTDGAYFNVVIFIHNFVGDCETAHIIGVCCQISRGQHFLRIAETPF
ncbi:hypothetical protein SDC9_91145 [bioreactor metagenome]|uniref:Uncharacterized protein n=1 Tax=bioreactor metagenome TaxID=1076179 RepID=A0A644ZUN3_9ZZZZ